MENQAVIVVGMAYGDESKGATVDYLCREMGATLTVRFNGGHQAAHNVITPDGRHHTFSQFGSGSFIPGVKTHLSRFMLVNPLSMLIEEEHLRKAGVTDIWQRTAVDENCVVVTPYHRAFNRLEELSRGHRAHGSCGVGIGCTRRLELDGLALRVKDLAKPLVLKRQLEAIRHRLSDEARNFYYRMESVPEAGDEDALLQAPDIDILRPYRHWLGKVKIVSGFTPEPTMIFEGAQGVLLDETHGTAPHNTWTNTTFGNALTLLNESGYDGKVTKLGCWRSYFTRHGNGPFPTEYASEYLLQAEKHNTHGRYQGNWRVGGFDWQLAKQAVDICNGIDEISVSHLDIRPVNIELLQDALKAKLTIMSFGPTANDRK